MFRLIEPSSGQTQNIVLVHSVSAHIMGSHTVQIFGTSWPWFLWSYIGIYSMGSHNVCTHWMYQYYVLYSAWWWLNEPKHVTEFLIWVPIYVVFIDWINYYIIQHSLFVCFIYDALDCTRMHSAKFVPFLLIRGTENIFVLWKFLRRN